MAVTYPTVTMQKSGGTLYTFPAPRGGGSMRTVRAQALGMTAAGAVVHYDKSATWYEATLTFDVLSTTNKSNLETHFAAVAGGAFTYVDSGSNSFTAYFLDTQLAFEQISRGGYNIVIQLRLSAAGT